MADVLLTYDIKTDVRAGSINESKNFQVKEALHLMGYHNHVVSDKGLICWLPNTTVYKAITTTDQAYTDLRTAAQQCGAEIERAIVVETPPTWKALQPGKPYDKQW